MVFYLLFWRHVNNKVGTLLFVMLDWVDFCVVVRSIFVPRRHMIFGVIFSIVTSLNNDLIDMLSTGEFLYVLSLNVKHVLRLISGSGSTWNPIWVLG